MPRLTMLIQMIAALWVNISLNSLLCRRSGQRTVVVAFHPQVTHACITLSPSTASFLLFPPSSSSQGQLPEQSHICRVSHDVSYNLVHACGSLNLRLAGREDRNAGVALSRKDVP